MIKGIFKEALKRGIIKNNIMLDIEKPRSKKEEVKVRGLTMDERKAFIKAITENNVNYSAQMLVSLYTGMRMGEVNALKVSDINFTFDKIHISRTITKGEDGKAIVGGTAKTAAGKRSIPLTPEVKEILKAAIGDRKTGLIFSKGNGSPISTGCVRDQFTRARKKYDFIDDTYEGRVDLHSLRHTYATICIEAGMKPNVLQRLMGHTDIRVTMNTYADVFEQHQDDEIDKLTRYLSKSGLSLFSGDDKDGQNTGETA